MKPDKCLVCNGIISIILEKDTRYKVHCYNCLITFDSLTYVKSGTIWTIKSAMWFNDTQHGMKRIKDPDVFGTFEHCCRIYKLKAFS